MAALALGIMWASGAAASNAWGLTYCVANPGCVTGGGVSQPDVQSALTAAAGNGGDDTVRVGTGTFQAAGPGGFTYSGVAGNTVQLVGAGQNQTILTAPNVNGSSVTTLDVEMASGGGSTISDLAVHLPGASGSGQSTGIFAIGADIDHVAVTTPLTVNGGSMGIFFQTGTLQHSTVSVPQGLGGVAAVRVIADGSGTIADSTLSGYYGIYGDASSTPTMITARRDRIDATGGNAGIYTKGTSLTAEDVLIQTNGTGVHTFCLAALDGTSTLRNVTITGAPIFGLYDECATNGRTATINLDSSIIDNPSFSIFRDGNGPSGGTPNVVTSYSDYPDSTGSIAGSAGSLTETSVMRVDPKFVNAAAQDFRLRFDSPLLDLGNPTNSGGPRDLDGLTRVVNGRLDMGAFEYQRRPPSAVATVSPGAVTAGQAVTFDGTASSDPDPGDTIGYAWTFDDGTTATGPIASHVFTAPGSHTGTLTVTDSTNLHASATAAVVAEPTGQRAAALGKCKKKKSAHARKKCRKRAKRLPL
jgi:PKD repeat protein